MVQVCVVHVAGRVFREVACAVYAVQFLLLLVDVCLEIQIIDSSYDLLPEAIEKLLLVFKFD